MNMAVRRLDRQDRLKGDREPMIHNQQLKSAVRRSANLRPIKLMAVGLAAAQGTIGRAQSVVPVVCYGLDRKHCDRHGYQGGPIRDRTSSPPQKAERPVRASPVPSR